MDPRLLSARMLEQAAPWTPWNRRTWEPSTLLRLRELSEASRMVHLRVLSEGTFTWLRKSLVPLLGQDLGLSNGAYREQLQALLARDFSYLSQTHRRFDYLVTKLETDYVKAWLSVLRSGADFSVERPSRFIVSHLIDVGFDASWVAKQLKPLLRASDTHIDDLLETIERILSTHPSVFEGVVRLRNVPHSNLIRSHPSWRDPNTTNAFILTSGGVPDRSQNGSLFFSVEARDPNTAAMMVRRTLEQWVDRTRFVPGKGILEYEPVWYLTSARQQNLHGPYRMGVAKSLVTTAQTYPDARTTSQLPIIDDAFHLASSMFGASDAVAVAGMWGAVESLLAYESPALSKEQRGRTIAAERAAHIVAAAWPRAELTKLGFTIPRDPNCPLLLKKAIEAAGSDHELRAGVVLQRLSECPDLTDPADQATLARVKSLQADPGQVLLRVRKYIESSLRRLYRQRNIVLHGGGVTSLALEPTVRTSAPLIAILLDRVLHASSSVDMEPMTLAAVAEVELDLARTASGSALHVLLPGPSAGQSGSASASPTLASGLDKGGTTADDPPFSPTKRLRSRSRRRRTK